MLYTEPELSHQLLQKITDSTINYLKGQIEAGADIIQVFDSWAGILSPEQFEVFSTPYIKQICDAIQEVPVTLFAKGAYFARQSLANLDCQTIGLDWNMNIKESRAIVGDNKTLQGNLDPCALYSAHSEVERLTNNMLDSFKSKRHIVNLGHGVYPDVDPEKVKTLIQTVKSYEIHY